MNKNTWTFRNLVFKFFLGDIGWARLRRWVILLSLFLWAISLSSIAGSPITLRSLSGLRYLLAPLFSVVSVFLLSARYVQDIYNLNNYSASLRYILASFWGFGYPRARIEKGRKDPVTDKWDLLGKIGGPGYLKIDPGNVVLLERLQSPSAVCGSGIHFVARFDRIKEIVDLDEQQFDSKLVEATSKDGIPIVVRNVYFRYILSPGPNRVRTISDPYPYSVQAIRNLAYNRAVGKDGQLTYWEKAVQLVIDGVISNYISEHQVDQITAPRYLEKDARYEISELIRSARTRSRLRNIGTELTWFDIGSINVGREMVDIQRLKAWQATWKRRSTVVRAQGEAQRIAYQELSRVETQSELLKGILTSFSNIAPSDRHKENVRKIVMARTAQLLESMTSLYQNSDDGLLSTLEEHASNGFGKRSSISGQPEDTENI